MGLCVCVGVSSRACVSLCLTACVCAFGVSVCRSASVCHCGRVTCWPVAGCD